tara:strand:- start:90 stop:2261 length:2172 start_codon:yes stop_codon:yes gene_type:complete
MMQAVGYENGGGVLSNIFNYLRTPDEENPMMQLIQNTIDPSTSAPDDPRISDELMQYLASQKPRLQGGAVPGGSFPTSTIDSQDSVFKMPPINALPYQPRPPQDTERDDIGDMIVAEKGPTSDEGIRARVAESAAQGKSAAETADELGMYVQDVLDVGVGLIGSGILEGTAFALDVASAIESGIVGNRAAGEAYAGGARNVKGFSDRTFYNKGDSLPRVSSIFPSEEDAAEQERLDAIRQASLANIGSADMEGADTGVFADTGDSIPVSSDSLGQKAIKERIISDYLGREPIKVGRTFPTGSRLNQFGGQLNRPDDMALYSSDPDPVKQGVASILPGLVNEPPAEVPQTMKELISEKLVDLGAGGVENIGGLFDQGVEYLEGLISGGDKAPEEKTSTSPNPMSLGEREAEADPSVIEELSNTAGELTSKLTKKAQDAIDTVKKKLEDPQSVEETPTIENNESVEEAPTIENKEPITKVQLDDETANEPILTEKTANDLFGGDTNLTTTITKLTKDDVGKMTDDLSNVTDDESFESYVSKYVKQYQELFKEDEAQIAKDKGFAMAIFGSVFASTGDWGQASAAMIDMLRGDKATRQAREDKVKMLALNSAADREAADLKYRRDLGLATIKGKKDRSDYLYKSTYDKAFQFYLDEGKPQTEATQLAKNAAKAAAPNSSFVTSNQESGIPSDVLSEYQKFIKENPTLKDQALKRLEEEGYNTKGLE